MLWRTYKRRALHLIVMLGEEMPPGQTLTESVTLTCHSMHQLAPLRSTTMTSAMWIDLNAAAGWLSSTPEDVMTLVRDRVLGANSRFLP